MKKNYINFLKSISIIFVICIHLLSRAWSNINVSSLEFKLLTIIDSICLVCVPIFLMCSGAIFLNRNDSIKKIIFKYMLKIYLVAVLFGFLYRLADYVVYSHGVINFNIIYNFIKQSLLLINIYHLWYLKVILFMYLTIPIFRYLLKSKIKYIDHIILIVLFIICMILPIFISNNIYTSIYGYLIYFYLGYYLDKYNNKKIVITLLLFGIISYIYTVYKTINVSIINNIACIDYMQYLSINIMFISCFVYSFNRLIENIFNGNKIKKILNFTTKCNFYIYLIHGFVIGLLTYLNIINIYNYSNIFMLFINLIIVYFICLLISYLMYIVINIIKKIEN